MHNKNKDQFDYELYYQKFELENYFGDESIERLNKTDNIKEMKSESAAPEIKNLTVLNDRFYTFQVERLFNF